MWKTGLVCSALLLMLSGGLAAAEPQRSGEPIGDSISRGVRQVESKLRETWAEIQRGTQRMTVEARVYARLYWDKSLVNATLAIEGRDDGVVVLKGSVPSVAAQQRAVELAQSTVGVNKAIDQLAVAPAPPAETK